MGKAPQSNGRTGAKVFDSVTGGYHIDKGSAAGKSAGQGGLAVVGGNQGSESDRDLGNMSKDQFGSMNGKQAGKVDINGGVNINPEGVAYQKHDDHVYKN